MGLSATDVANAASLMLAPTQVGQMFAEGRVKFVMLQAAAPYRMSRSAFNDFYTPSSTQKNADGTPMYPARVGLAKYWYPDLNDAPPIGVTAAAAANDNNKAARVVAKPATVTAKPAGSKPWAK